MSKVCRLVLPFLLVACASTPAYQGPPPTVEECGQRLEAELAVEFPPGVDPDSVREAELDTVLVRYREGREEPGDTARTLERYPRLRGITEVQQLMRVYYPENLLSRGIGGTARLLFFVRPDGAPQNFRVEESTGYSELDEASIWVILNSRFAPGIAKGCPVWGMVSMPVTWVAAPGPY